MMHPRPSRLALLTIVFSCVGLVNLQVCNGQQSNALRPNSLGENPLVEEQLPQKHYPKATYPQLPKPATTMQASATKTRTVDSHRSNKFAEEFLAKEFETTRQFDELERRIKQLILHGQQNDRLPRTTSPPPQGTEDTSAKPLPSKESGAGLSGVIGVEPTEKSDTPSPEEKALPLDTQRVLREPPDRLALANSLFFAGEFELAHSIFEQIAKTSPTTSRTWIEYQSAACLKRLEQNNKSQTAFRMVAEQDGAGLLGINARWWLEVTDRKQQLKQELELFSNVIEQRKEMNDELISPDRTDGTTAK